MKEHLKRITESLLLSMKLSHRKITFYASLPDAYNVLVTALESGSENIPALVTVTERLLREEDNLKGKEASEEALVTDNKHGGR